MSAEIINQVLAEEAGRLSSDILTETMHQSPWIDLVQTGLWPEGMSDTLRILTFGRSFPATAGGVLTGGTWSTISSSDYGAAGGSCLPTVTNVKAGTTYTEFQLKQTALESDRLCVTNLRNSFMRDKQLNALKSNLAESTKFVLVERARDEFASLCTNHMLVTTAGVVESTTMPSGSGKVPAVVKQALLTKTYEKLIFNGAGTSKLIPRVDGAPIFPFITSFIQSDTLKQETNYRDDYRWDPNMVGELLKVYAGLGALSKPVRGFQHIVDPLPPRWEYSGGWNRIWPYIISGDAGASETGYTFEENPAYLTAAWEDSFVYNPDVFRMLYPSAITNAGGGASFQPVQYRGEWKWMNQVNLDTASEAYNPDGTLGRFRAVFSCGSEPIKPRFGVRIRHARCINNTALYAACS